MSGPAQFGVIVYTANPKRLAQFYLELFDMVELKSTPELVSLGKEGFNIVLHAPPPGIEFASPGAVKAFITVPSITEAKRHAQALGGMALEGEWANPLFTVANILDPEHNPIQLRMFTTTPSM
jgi:predicted enzyme related to lactoylglutathione lyase